MRLRRLALLINCATVLLIASCKQRVQAPPHGDMVSVLKKAHKELNVAANPLCPEAGLPFIDSLLKVERDPGQITYYGYMRGKILMALGKNEECIQQLSEVVKGDEKN